MTIRLQTEAFTNMVTLFAEDEFSQQAICLTPAEARDLVFALLKLDIPNDAASEREAASLRLLTLYNGHALPSIEREALAKHINLIGPQFHFELWQVFTNGEHRQITEM